MKSLLVTWTLVLFPALTVSPALAGVPAVSRSYFVPQAGTVSTPVEGALAIRNFRTCPDIDGAQVLRLNARLKIVVQTSDGSPIAGIAASDVCVMFNGGTPAQGFSGVGDDSIIANFQFNQLNNCPDVRCLQADAPTDANGVTYLTWIGGNPSLPGTELRNPFHKWGQYAGDVPVMALGFKLQGKIDSAAPLGSYTAHVKNLDNQGGRGTAPNQGEQVNSLDIAPVQAAIGAPYKYSLDFDNNGTINSIDLSFIKAHNTHKCNFPSPN